APTPVALAAVVALTLSACGSNNETTTAGDKPAPGTAGSSSAAGGVTGTVTVLAAASLTESFDQIKADFEAANPGATIEVSYGSSATLVQQVNGGAPANVIALAGEAAAEPLDRAKVKQSSVFATNTLEIAVPEGNPGKVTGIADFGKADLRLVLCEASVPCGKAAATTLEKAKVNPSIDSFGSDVKATLRFVEQDEADAAIVYRSDVASAKDAVEGVEIPANVNTSLRYPIIRLDDKPATSAFVDYVTSDKGSATVQSFGLGAP
ncbi:MAG: molybdate ABC transporter substrate-binding protein, partial [Micrococcales bacterium]|nr:molybdate ABC transporter substrate-binding protein [Micrococcales bacterium]